MAVDTVNYDPSLEERLRESIQHLYKVNLWPAGGGSYPLAIDGDLSVSFSLGWAPYAQASFTCKKPTDAAQLAALDGRLRTYAQIQLGYALDGSTTSINEAVRLRIDDVEETPNRLHVTLQGKEMEAQDATWAADWNTLVPRSGVREFIAYVLSQSLNGTVNAGDIWAPGTGAGYRPDLVADVNPSSGANLWSIASGVADSAGLKLWHDGGQTWKLQPRYGLSDTYATMLRTGKSGTIVDWSRKLSRREWYNRVDLRFPDSPQPNGSPMLGVAQISSGPYGTLAVGAKTYSETLPGWASAASATARAQSMLATLSARGSSYSITAKAAYWLRPGMTVPVKTGLGPYEKQLVESVTFTPLNGLMSLTTIKNEDGAA